MSFGSHSGYARTHYLCMYVFIVDSLAVAWRRCGNKRKEEGKKKRKGKLRTHEVFYEHLAHSLIQPPICVTNYATQRALVSVPLLIDPTRWYTRTRIAYPYGFH